MTHTSIGMTYLINISYSYSDDSYKFYEFYWPKMNVLFIHGLCMIYKDMFIITPQIDMCNIIDCIL